MLSRNISAVYKHFPFLYIYSPSQVYSKMQIHSEPALLQLHSSTIFLKKITSGQASNGNNNWQTLQHHRASCGVKDDGAAQRDSAQTTPGLCPAGWGAHDHLPATLGTLQSKTLITLHGDANKSKVFLGHQFKHGEGSKLKI